MPNKYNISYSDIVELFTSASNDNLSVATFDSGTIDFLDANGQNKNYPYIYLRPVSSPGVVDKVRTLTFELYSMDVPTLANQSPVDTISECEERIYQLMSWFNRGPTPRQQIWDITMTDLSPVNEAFQDRVFGWVATIEVASPWNWDYCDYPQVVTPTPGPTSSPTPSPTATPTPTATPVPTATPIPPLNIAVNLLLQAPSSGWDSGGSPADAPTFGPISASTDLSVWAQVRSSSYVSNTFPCYLPGAQIFLDEALTTPYNPESRYTNYWPLFAEYSTGSIPSTSTYSGQPTEVVTNGLSLEKSDKYASGSGYYQLTAFGQNDLKGVCVPPIPTPTPTPTVDPSQPTEICWEITTGSIDTPPPYYEPTCGNTFNKIADICIPVECPNHYALGNYACSVVNGWAYQSGSAVKHQFSGSSYVDLTDNFLLARTFVDGGYYYAKLEFADIGDNGTGIVESAWACSGTDQIDCANDMAYPAGYTGVPFANDCTE